VPDDWNSYLCNVNDELASVRVNLGLRAKVPDPGYAWLLWVWVYLKQPRTDGLSSGEEAQALWSLEDALVAALANCCSAVLSGCITTCGRREFYFYGSSANGFEHEVSKALRGSGYQFDCDKQKDEGWTQYLNVLFPSEEQRQVIENRRLMDLMKERGDKLEGTREVSHWVHFKEKNGRMAFWNAVEGSGYRVVQEFERLNDECPFWVVLARRQKMASAAMDEAVLELFRKSKTNNGEYDGWECELVAEQVEPKEKPVGDSGSYRRSRFS